MATGSFTAEQIQTFRRIYREQSGTADGGLEIESFAPAVEECLRAVGLPQPPSSYLNSEFRRLSTTDTVPWQQFFQVLIHCNLNHVQGVGYNDEPAAVEDSGQATVYINVPHDPSYLNEQTTAAAGGNSAGIEMTGSSRGRVGFADSPEIATFEAQTDSELPVEPSTSWGQTLVRSGALLGRRIGAFFGVTEESQYGTSDQAGWGQVSQASAGDHFSTGRRLSFRTNVVEEPPPEYPGPPSLTGAAGGRSFDPAELSGSSDEEDDNLFIAPAPPDYHDIVGSEQLPPPTVSANNTVTVVDVIHVGSAQIAPPAQQHYPPSSHPAQQQQPPLLQPLLPQQPTVTEGHTDFIYDPTDAWNYYKRFVQAERSLRQRRHHQGAFEFFGSVDTVESNANGVAEVGRRGSIRRDRLDPAADPVVLRRHKKKKSTKLQRQSTLVRHKVESLPSFTPWFIIVMSILQVVALIVLIATNGGVAKIRAIPIEHTDEFPSLISNNSNATATVTYYEAVNLWIGLSPLELIKIGAKFTPCMRRDFGIQDRNTRLYGNNRDTVGCCKNRDNVGTVITTSECICTASAGVCSAQAENATDIAYIFGGCSETFDNSTLGLPSFHPCCVSITGLCLVTSNEECDARGGEFHPTRDSCLEVNCLEDICGFNGASIGADSGTPYLPKANQFWRFFLSIFIHLGVIHIIIVIPIQLYIGFKIERTIGWLRVGLIYLISGVGGNIVSGVFVTYGVNAGASGAVLGLIGVLFVELFQFWQIVDTAPLELAKLMGFVIFLLAVGTLPFVDNMAHIGGLVFGVVSAIIFVPYITFGKLDTFRKRILLAICIPLLILLFVSGLLTFYLIPDSSFCPECGYINCIPYVPALCPEEYRDADTDVYSL